MVVLRKKACPREVIAVPSYYPSPTGRVSFEWRLGLVGIGVARLRGAFSRMHRALDGWMLARAPASPVQGLHHHGPRYFDFPYFCTKCVALRNLDLLIKTGWSVIFPVFC